MKKLLVSLVIAAGVTAPAAGAFAADEVQPNAYPVNVGGLTPSKNTPAKADSPAAPTAASDTLPSTGSDSYVLLRTGTLVLLAGGALVVVGSARRRNNAAA